MSEDRFDKGSNVVGIKVDFDNPPKNNEMWINDDGTTSETAPSSPVAEVQGNMFSPFGPPVYHGGIRPDFLDHVTDCIEQRRGSNDHDMSGMLAGRVDEQILIEDLVSDECKDHILSHVMTVIDNCSLAIPREHLEINGLWVNISNNAEFNPIHSHDGLFSFVFYTKNTVKQADAIDNKFDSDTTPPNGGVYNNGAVQPLAGHIELHYGETQFLNWSTFSHFPLQGDLLVFPSWLRHSVYPFYCGGERISVAGNIRFKQQ